MGEKIIDVKPQLVEYICDDCGTGIMIPDNSVLTSFPPKWKHVCNNCGAAKILSQSYPTIIWTRL